MKITFSDNLEKLICILLNKPSAVKEIYLLVKNILEEIVNTTNKNELIAEIDQKMGIQFFDVDEKQVQKDLYNIIYDLSTLMVDSIENKKLANNFSSMPDQLLDRLKKLKNKI